MAHANNKPFGKDDSMRYENIINAWAETNDIAEGAVENVKDFCEWYNIVPTKAQLKVMTDWAWKLNWFFNEYAEGYALSKVFELKEPHYLDVYFNYGSDEAIMRYIAVANEDACKTALKSNETCQKVLDRINACKKGRDDVFAYALWNANEQIINNAYRAVWYIVATDCGHGSIIDAEFSTKQLKDTMSRPDLIDRYAMIEHRDYSDILVYQAGAIAKARKVIEDLGGTITVFKESIELANEGCRMGNCIGTYWNHDEFSCLFAVDYKDTRIDVELVCANMDEDIWEVSQVYTNNNRTDEVTKEVQDALCTVFKCEEYDDDFNPVFIGEDAGEGFEDENAADARRARHDAFIEYELMRYLNNVCEEKGIDVDTRVDIWEATRQGYAHAADMTCEDIDRAIADYIDR